MPEKSVTLSKYLVKFYPYIMILFIDRYQRFAVIFVASQSLSVSKVCRRKGIKYPIWGPILPNLCRFLQADSCQISFSLWLSNENSALIKNISKW